MFFAVFNNLCVKYGLIQCKTTDDGKYFVDFSITIYTP